MPVMPQTKAKHFYPGCFYERNGPSALNTWLAGAAGMARLARRHGWQQEEETAVCLFARLALARIGMARYTAEQHRMGITEGNAQYDWRTVVHHDQQ